MTRLLALILLLLPCPAQSQDLSREVRLSPDLIVRPLADGVWLHENWMEAPGFGRFSANGLIIVSADDALLVDTPANDELTELLLRFAANSLGAPIRRAIHTHAHNDRIGGIGALKGKGIVSFTLPETADLAEAQGWPRPDSLLDPVDSVSIGERRIETFYPGAGHTRDNLVVWLPEERILYGGCFLKSEDAAGIGNVADADLEAWPVSVERTMARYPDVQIVVPGHGIVGGSGAFTRTLEILAGE